LRERPGEGSLLTGSVAVSGRGERNTVVIAIQPNFIAQKMISAGFSSVCGLAKNGRCT